MDKFKVYSLDSSFDLMQIKNKLSSFQRSSDINFEFTPIKFTDFFLSYKYSEKKILETSFLDKNGNEQTIEYLHIDSFEFRIINSKNKFYILLINPSRSLKLFKQYLVELLDYKIGFSEIEINPLDLLSKIEKLSNSEFFVLSMEIKDIIFNNNTSGVMTLKSLKDIRNYYKEIVTNKNFKINKILISNNDFFRGKLILCKDASFQIESLNSIKLMELILDNLN
ncbi:hypothetical protein [Acinetobacter baumannii]|uniref:hypothetical protein n=1 Tax=Acinetobacter baumannii TaxID=470 RepID=UPI0013B8B931|nr:hypothetical protein [Acinetobacter baumannii]NDX18362.1 hypothetical protein [Acinetobacter baumannii]NDX36571.1 hypothetical protein [Acinetobacter baumannii]